MANSAPIHDKESERALLGSMLLDARVIVEVTTIVKPADLHDVYHRQLFTAIVTINDACQPIDDIVVLKSQITQMDIEWDAAYIAKILDCVPTATNAVRYAHTIRQLSRRRQIIDLSNVLSSKANDATTDLEDITSYARQYVEIMQAGSREDLPVPVSDALQKLVDDLDKKHSAHCLPTGFPTIDSCFGMLQASELTAVGARPGGGKTTFSVQLARHNAGSGRRVLYVSLEMGELEFAKRLACLELGVDPRLLRQGSCPHEEKQRVRELTDEWHSAELPFLLWAPPSATDAEIESRARYADACGGLDLLIVDHLQITRCSNKKLDRYQQLGEITMRLKALAKELEIPVIAQTQLKRSESRPSLSSIRESGDIEQNCDNVWFLHREENCSEFIVEKFRHGSTGSIDLNFVDGRFSDPAVADLYPEFEPAV